MEEVSDLKAKLAPGLRFDMSFKVPETKMVPHLYPEAPEFQQMPEVLATGFMVGLVEWACLRAVIPHLDWPEEQTVGVHVDLSHTAATPAGLVVTVTGELVEVLGSRLRFDVHAHDGIDLITRGKHERHVIDKRRFESGVARKAASVAGIKQP